MFHHPIQPPPIPPAPEDAQQLVALARSVVGITIDSRKTDFLMGRLGRRLTARGLTDYGSYCRLVRSDAAERAAFGEALTTHTTSFFRESAQYDWLLEEGLAELEAAGRGQPRPLVIWSAACSTGQEGYSALMVAHQACERGLRGLSPRLVGTDVSRPVLRQAARALYRRQEIEGIPAELRRRFLLSSRKDDDLFRVAPELRGQASWRQANLATGEGLDGIAADAVFLRNVLIYFDEEMRARVIANVLRRLRPGGFLLLGHTEASLGRDGALELVRPSIYRKGSR